MQNQLFCRGKITIFEDEKSSSFGIPFLLFNPNQVRFPVNYNNNFRIISFFSDPVEDGFIGYKTRGDVRVF